MNATHVCLSCLSTLPPVRGRCAGCGRKSWASEAVQRTLSDYNKGLDRRTRAAGSVTIEPETGGHYFGVFDTGSGEKLMCGFDTPEQAFAWCIHRGMMPVRTAHPDTSLVGIFTSQEVAEKLAAMVREAGDHAYVACVPLDLWSPDEVRAFRAHKTLNPNVEFTPSVLLEPLDGPVGLSEWMDHVTMPAPTHMSVTIMARDEQHAREKAIELFRNFVTAAKEPV